MNITPALLIWLSAASLAGAQASVDWSGWRWHSEFAVAQAGTVRVRIEPEIADRSLPGLEDLRLVDGQGRQIPFVVETPRRRAGRPRGLSEFRVAQETPEITGVEFETGSGEFIDGVTLHTPASGFVKAASVYGQREGGDWSRLAEGRQIFVQGNSRNLRIQLARASWDRLRVELRDSASSPPIPISGVEIHLADVEDLPVQSYPCQVMERIEAGNVSRLQIRLPYRNLYLLRLDLQTPASIFKRRVQLLTRQATGDQILMKKLVDGMVSRLPEEAAVPDPVGLEVGQPIARNEIFLDIESADSGPLEIEAVTAVAVPDFAVFRQSGDGVYRFLFGNPMARRPGYDLEALKDRLGEGITTPVVIPGVPRENPGFAPTEPLPGFTGQAARFDSAGWGFRKQIRVRRPGIQSLELDLDVLSEISKFDLRVVQQEQQLAYLSDPEGTVQELRPEVSEQPVEQPSRSRWSLRLPKGRLPILNVHCQAAEKVFRRRVVIYEAAEGRRGSQRRRVLAETVWTRLRPGQSHRLWLALDERPETDLLFLQIENADNPPLRLEDFRVQLRIPRLIFKALSGDDLWLYYGNRRAAPPRYDIRLIADDLFESPKTMAELEGREVLRPSIWWSGESPSGLFGILFWGALGLGTVILLWAIARLLPPADPGPAG